VEEARAAAAAAAAGHRDAMELTTVHFLAVVEATAGAAAREALAVWVV
jgi:hypothetical protein